MTKHRMKISLSSYETQLDSIEKTKRIVITSDGEQLKKMLKTPLLNGVSQKKPKYFKKQQTGQMSIYNPT